jgi:hypothetical protein
LLDAVDGEHVGTVVQIAAGVGDVGASNRIVFIAKLRKVAVVRGAVPVLTWDESSRNVTSLT